MAGPRYNRIWTDARELVLLIMRQCIVQNRNGDNFRIYDGLPEIEKVANNHNYIAVYRMDPAQGEQVTLGCREDLDFTFRYTVIKKCDVVNQGYYQRYYEQLDNLDAQFGKHWRSGVAYNFQYQNETITDLRQVGIKEITRTNALPWKNGNVEGVEYGVTITFQFTNNNLKIAS